MIFSTFIVVTFSTSLLCASDWTIALYMESTDNLSDMALKNIEDIMRAPSTAKNTILVQLHAYGERATRYKIEQGLLKKCQEVLLKTKSKENLCEFAHWAFSSYPSKFTMLVLWNHGWGILEPFWDDAAHKWKVESDTSTDRSDGLCSIMKNRESHQLHKGFLFNHLTKSFLTTPDLTEVVQTLQSTVLAGKKLDILGLDTCMGAMVEIAFAISKQVNFLIASQNCELKDGWNYEGFLTKLHDHAHSPRELCQNIVNAFQDYYASRSHQQSYSLSAVDLEVVHQLTLSFEACCRLLIHSPELIQLVRDARMHCPGFCFVPMYIDLYLLIKKIKKYLDTKAYPHLDTTLAEIVQQLKQSLVARCFGEAITAHGLSIYFPQLHIDRSYYESSFAHATGWLNLLTRMHNKR